MRAVTEAASDRVAQQPTHYANAAAVVAGQLKLQHWQSINIQDQTLPRRLSSPGTPGQDNASTGSKALISPLDLILETMRARYDGKDIDGAVALARVAAPYLHPRMPSHSTPNTLADIQDADLDKLQPQD